VEVLQSDILKINGGLSDGQHAGGAGGYIAEPMETDASTTGKKVRKRIYENDCLVSDRIKEFCEGQKYEPHN
jgi:hypothetical protein